jgi:DNA-binding transcriptional regulator YhcF (GntR family)
MNTCGARTDSGMDLAVGGTFGDGSVTTFAELVEVVRRSDTIVLPVYLDTVTEGRHYGIPMSAYIQAQQQLSELAAESGNAVYQARSVRDLNRAYTQVIHDLDRVYSIGYRPAHRLRDGSWRAVAVQLVGNHIDSTVNNPIEAVAQWRAGQLRPLCVFDDHRMPYTAKVTETQAWGDIPTCKDSGLAIEYVILEVFSRDSGRVCRQQAQTRPGRRHDKTFEHRMSTISDSTGPDPVTARTLRPRSVVGLAYDEVRGMIVAGSLAPGSRLGQGELADQLGISRGSVREALRRLAGDGLVEFEVNRGFFVSDLGLGQVRQRLEARLVLEPEVARLAAERRTGDDVAAMRSAIATERAARSSDAAHDATGRPISVAI